MTAVPAQAQTLVHDPRSLAQMIQDARTAIEQLDSLKAQVQQGQELFASLNELSNVNAIAERLGLPEIRNPLPDMATLRSAADGDLSALGELAERADAIRRETRVYTPDAPSAAAEALERAGARTARDLAIGETVDRAATDRLEGLEELRRALDTAPNARAVMDLNARLAAEQALIQNEQVRLQGLALTQAAEARLEDQRARERIAAERSARMDAYRQAFQ
nr:type IV secretion system protein [uncultured Brevundimonas sp.]